MAYNPQDHYFKKAKKEGYLARSAYKLEEINSKHKILRKGIHVLDLGCAPGSWSQYVLKVLSGSGKLYGIDLKPVGVSSPNAVFEQKNIFELPSEQFQFAPYDVVLSDMAPNTTGIAITDQARSEELCLKVVAVSDVHLKKGGHLVMKLFMGSGAKGIELELKKRFEKAVLFRPKSVRQESTEIYVIGIKKKV